MVDKKKEFHKFLSDLDLSPIVEFTFKYKDADIFILREDKLPFSYGGNKLRIALEIFKDFFENKYEIMLSYGSLNSNFNRVIADLCKKFNIPCYILSSVNDEEYESLKNINRKKHFNEILCDKAGAKRFFCKKEDVRLELENLMKKLSCKGKKIYYINKGLDGKGNEDILERAYEELFSEYIDYSKFSFIYLAYGTGSTYRGILKAKTKLKDFKPYLVGISIARDIDSKDYKNNAFILSKYKGKYYGSKEKEIYDFINNIYTKYNIALDPIYTAKAFFGMLKEIENNNIKGNILFIHTGGYPIYKEYILNQFE